MKKYLLMCALLACCSSTSRSQTYTDNEFVASAPLAWQTQYDPAARLTIGPDDGNASASPNVSLYASTIRYGGAQGLEGLLYDFTISAEGPPTAFGLARRGCEVTNASSSESCIRVRWEPFYFNGQLISMSATISYNNQSLSYVESDIHQGDSFSIERVGDGIINFYRSTGTLGERRRVATAVSPFLLDGYALGTWIEPRAVFAPSSTARKLAWGSERYYCCL